MSVPLLFGPYGSTQLPENVKEYGVNAVWFQGFNESVFNDCQDRGLFPCVEFRTFRVDFRERPELIPIGVDGKPIRYGQPHQGVCLSQTDFLAELEERLLQGLKSYQPTGIWLDYLHYSGWFETPTPDLQDSCFCSRCITEFCEGSQLDAPTAQVILELYADEWKAHKCRKVAKFALHYATLIRERQPECIIGAYMCPYTPEESNGALTAIFAQDYNLLASAIDVFTPLIYCMKSGRSIEWCEQWLESSRSFVPSDKKVQLILEHRDFPHNLRGLTSPHKVSWGIQLAGGAQILQDKEKADLFRRAVDSILESV